MLQRLGGFLLPFQGVGPWGAPIPRALPWATFCQGVALDRMRNFGFRIWSLPWLFPSLTPMPSCFRTLPTK